MEDSGKENKEVHITYETLFELLRREKSREVLQKLDIFFFDDVSKYMKEKKESLEQLKHKEDIFVVEERERAEKQMQNIRRILKEFYERREKKIINMAIDASRTSANIIDAASFLPHEKRMYDMVMETLSLFRRGILANVLEAKKIYVEDIKKELREKAEKLEESKCTEDTSQASSSPDLSNPFSISMIRFTGAVPKFVGENLEEYGPFEKDDIANLPKIIAEIIVSNGRAEYLN